MQFVQIKCSNCGAILQIESTKETVTCQFCGTPFVVGKDLNEIAADCAAGDKHSCNPISDFVIRAGTLEKYVGESVNVIIPDSVSIIGSAAFLGCAGLASVIVPNSVTVIGADSFSRCTGLTGIDIPESVTTIGNRSFSGCAGLKRITIPSSVTNIGASAFSGCTGLEEIIIPDSVESIGESAFKGCSILHSFRVPESITIIREYVFRDCVSLNYISFGKQIKNINWLAFENCGRLQTVDFRGEIADFCQIEFGGLFDDYNITDFLRNAELYVNGRLITELTEMDLSTIDHIGVGAFAYYTRLKSLTIPFNVKRVGGKAFYYCTGLQNVRIDSKSC